jgi:hypothetical protein
MSEKSVSLARDFSRFPGPRFIKQGPHSGELFRRKLLDWLKRYDRIVVDLDGTTGIGSSFIDEAFGGLIFAEGMSREDVRKRVRVRSRLDESYLIEFEDSVRRAKAKQVA